jgi:hypothetical protein
MARRRAIAAADAHNAGGRNRGAVKAVFAATGREVAFIRSA